MSAPGGRPLSEGRRPSCPDGHDGRIHFHGFRKRADGFYARPRYRCSHAVCGPTCRPDCPGSHTFTGVEQARTSDHPDGLWCRECDNARSERDGTPVAYDWDYEARLIADAMIAVGAGASFREAAEGMRRAARCVKHDAQGIAYASREGDTIARYLDHFGPLLVAASEHQEWPEVLVLDALPLRRREVRDDDPFSFEQSGNGAILCALGYTTPVARTRRRRPGDDPSAPARPARPKRHPHLWKVEVAGGYDRWSWLDFLSSLSGTPKWIVVDGDSAVRFAIRKRWGTGPDAPVIYSCEGHLMRKFHERARDQDRLDGIEIWQLWPENKRGSRNRLPGPLWSRDDYRRFLDAVLAIPPKRRENITNWILAHDEMIRRQFDLRDAHPGYPRGSGAVEAAIQTLDGWIGERRRSFQNVRRLRIVLSLMRAQIAGHADRALYSRIIRDELEAANGRPRLDWRRFHNPRSAWKGLFALSTSAERKVNAERPAYLVAAQAKTIGRKVSEMNLYHLASGYDPIEITNSATPSVIVEGKKVSDFPLIAREWDPANDGDPGTTSANSSREVGWICALDPSHRWRTAVGSRTRRLTGCGAMRGRAAVAHRAGKPDLAQVRRAWGPLELAPTVSGGEVEDEDLVEASA